MIKMTDNNVENVFAFFCDFCGKEIKGGRGEILFLDSEPSNPAEITFSHYDCSQVHERLTEECYGNMSLKDFVEYLFEQHGK